MSVWTNAVSRIDSVEAAEHFARRRVPKSLVQRIEGGSGTGSTNRDNVEAFERIKLWPRAAVAVGTPAIGTTVVGHEIDLPVLIAPTGNIRAFHPDGERGVARAASRAGTITCVSSATGTAIEEITAGTTGTVFFQLFYLGDRDSTEPMIERARNAGCGALVVTVDTAASIPRERRVGDRAYLPTGVDLYNMIRFAPQLARRPRWLAGFARDGFPSDAPMAQARGGAKIPTAVALKSILQGEIPVWDDLGWIRDLWGGPLIVKGILTAEDARRAAAEGASAVVVSNHGGMLFDALPPSIDALPRIAEAVGGELEVLLDSGVRRGVDVARAVARGARAVLIGRAYLWAHAAAGEAGVKRILDVFHSELVETLKLLGCRSIEDLDASYLGEDVVRGMVGS